MQEEGTEIFVGKVLFRKTSDPTKWTILLEEDGDYKHIAIYVIGGEHFMSDAIGEEEVRVIREVIDLLSNR